MDYELITITNINIKELKKLSLDAREDGFRFVQRTIDEWLLKINRFAKTGEVLYGIKQDEEIVAIGGLNIDPFVDDVSIGRIRHLYVNRDYREKGFSKYIMKKLIVKARRKFKKLRLSTNSEIAAEMYEKLGFVKVKEHKANYMIEFKKK